VLLNVEEQEEKAKDLLTCYLASFGDAPLNEQHPNTRADYVVYRALFTEVDSAKQQQGLKEFGKLMPYISNALIRLIVMFASEVILGLTTIADNSLMKIESEKLLEMLLRPTLANGVVQDLPLELVQSAQYAYSMTFRNKQFSDYQNRWVKVDGDMTHVDHLAQLAKLFGWTQISVAETRMFHEMNAVRIGEEDEMMFVFKENVFGVSSVK
jgi:hypothetical protein